MSRAFVKDDAPGGPVLIPPRAPLPPGTPNYVTPRGLRLLREERERLESERSALQAGSRDDPDRGRNLAVLAGRIAACTERIESARPVDPGTQPADEVRFGARVRLRTTSGVMEGFIREFTLVGVDEADPSERRIAFTAPIARAVTGRGMGERIPFVGPKGRETIVVESIEYRDTDPPQA